MGVSYLSHHSFLNKMNEKLETLKHMSDASQALNVQNTRLLSFSLYLTIFSFGEGGVRGRGGVAGHLNRRTQTSLKLQAGKILALTVSPTFLCLHNTSATNVLFINFTISFT